MTPDELLKEMLPKKTQGLTPEDRGAAVKQALDLAEKAMTHAMAASVGRAGFCEVAIAALQTASNIAEGDQ